MDAQVEQTKNNAMRKRSRRKKGFVASEVRIWKVCKDVNTGRKVHDGRKKPRKVLHREGSLSLPLYFVILF
jgi:hypothetical protein